MKNILLLNANPKAVSFCRALADSYEIEAREQANIHRFDLAKMDFNQNLETGYDKAQQLEKCLADFQQAILSADHIVMISPVWWGGLPAKFKGLIDRVFLPGFAFKYEGDDPEPIQLLKGKTSRLIFTMDAPEYFLSEQALPVLEQLDRFTLQFCGVAKAQVNLFGPMIFADDQQRNHWLQTVKSLGTVGG
ncbi:NAD(P)H-dependent oxidoreductase [Thalassomonas actiniarum]|uniref:NAD(P)H-dependent oxidoreductase n=1 Tax=Thalassomonas actiniarum TaxID=485447 RepID=A0AAF0C789_9GAMM|nr:NAD(P)H-dependent oxidoreductase [Thalassomonas actiniarum]WDE02609.1 NAD(P)H-dependent oxidoreductase [Thalassomonas actiniarum]